MTVHYASIAFHYASITTHYFSIAINCFALHCVQPCLTQSKDPGMAINWPMIAFHYTSFKCVQLCAYGIKPENYINYFIVQLLTTPVQ